ncbi:SDR family NAD(P)-dependent oxidoreductase, partial [Methylomagnum sp.]
MHASRNPAQLSGAAPPTDEAIAIVGVACRFPGARDYREFWRNLEAGLDAVADVPEDRWDSARHYSPDRDAPGKTHSRWGGYLDQIDRFDHRLFQISPREARGMDPQQRLLLEQAWRCVEDAGLGFERLRAGRTGVFVGTMTQDHGYDLRDSGLSIDGHAGTGSYAAILANRLSHQFGFTGPSHTVDAACASSLAALHQARRALLAGDCDYALVGAVNLNTHPWKYIAFSKARMLSPTGRCRTFDRDADGYVPGEGVAVLLLRPLSLALADGCHIHGLIRSTALGHGGRADSLTAPRVAAQRDVLLAAYRAAGLTPETLSYVEAHGTGTSLGDPIEVEALTEAFRQFTDQRGFCRIGSVKSNLGHLEAAAGLAGLVKVLGMLRQRRIFPTLHVRHPNPLIDFAASPFVLARHAEAWLCEQDQPRRAGVSAFGFGGANAHAVIEEYCGPERQTREEPAQAQLFVLSARSPASLRGQLESWAAFVAGEEFAALPLDDVCRTLQTGRAALPYRFGARVASRAELADAVRQALDGMRGDTTSDDVSKESSAWVLRLGQPGPELAPDPASCWANVQAYEQFRAHLPDPNPAAWPEPLRAFAALYGWAQRLLTVLPPPALITGEGIGQWVALALTGLLPVETCVAALSGEPVEAIPRRPALAYSDPALAHPILPKTCDAVSLHAAAQAFRVDDEVFSALLEQAEGLAEGQWTFRRFLEEWNAALSATGRDAYDWLKTARAGLAPVERERLAIVLLVTLRKLRRKWQLSERLPKLCPVLSGWADLVILGLLTPEEALRLPERDPTALARLAETLCGRLAASPLLALPDFPLWLASGAVPEIADPASWARGIGQNHAAQTLLPDFPALDAGEFAGPPNPAHISLTGPTARAFDAAMLALWRVGVQVDWDAYAGGTPFRRVALPVYVFDGPSFRLPRPAESTPIIMQPEAAPLPEIHPPSHFLAPVWHIQPPEPAALPAPTVALVVALDGGPLGPALVERLTEQGVTTYLARPGAGDVRTGEGAYLLDTARAEDYAALLAEALASARRIETLHIYWLNAAPTWDTGQPTEAALTQLERAAFREPWLFLQALLRQPVLPRCRLLSVTRDALAVIPGDHAAGFAGAAWHGLGQSAALEHGQLTCGLLDLDTASLSAPDLAERLCDELRAAHLPAWLAYRAGRRYGRSFEPIRLTDSIQPPAPPEGVVVISGGAGSIGSQVAEWLVERGYGAIALLGRSPLSAETRQRLADWRARGAAVEYRQADVAAWDSVQSALAELRRRHGGIVGVIHAAGVVEDRLLAAKPVDAAARVFAPKVGGALCLHEATLGDPLAFFILFSSVVGSAGNAGQADYAAANAVLDGFAAYRRAGGFPGRTLAIGWPLWRDGGMGRDETIVRHFAARGLEPLPPGAGLAAFAALFGTAAGAVLVHHSEQFQPDAARQESPAPVPSANPKTVTEPTENYREQVRRYVLDTLARHVGTEPESIRADESFFSLGLESLLLQELQEELGRVFPKLPPTLLFEYPNAEALTGYLARQPVCDLPGRTPAVKAVVESAPFAPSADLTQPTRRESPGQSASALRYLSANGGQPNRDEKPGYAIAVIGLAGRFPEAPDVAAYWENLLAGRDSIREIPPERWDLRRYFDPAMGGETASYGKWGGFIDAVDRFDALFFNVSPREAEQMDPQQRLLLETTFAALEDAGYGAARRRRGRTTGLFVGTMWNEYSLFSHEHGFLAGRYQGPGSQYWAIANRVSYSLDLRGPSVALDTACSSSLTALHLACQSLLAGDCEMALAGGVNLTLHPSKLVYLSQARFLSSDGRCRSFGAGGDGYVPGEGVGMVLLKPLDRALADGDRVYGVIRSSAANHGGRATGFTVPNPEAHAELIRAALARGGVDARDIGYVECHGTGTALGDPIEIRGLANAFGQHGTGRETCHVGSVKSNIGHLEAAAGVAGLIKVLLCLRHGLIPPSLHSAELNPRIAFADTPFTVARQATVWDASAGKPRLAGLSSFGAGGSNAHVIVEEYREPIPAHAAVGPAVVCLSARNEERLRVAAGQLADWLGQHPVTELADVAHTLNLGREIFEVRLAVVADDLADLRCQLQDYAENRGELFTGHVRDRANPHRGVALPERAEDYADLRPETLARAFAAGLEPDFAAHHRTRPGAWLSLPTYPFKRDRYWIEPAPQRPTAEAAPAPAHPWLDIGPAANAVRSWRVNLAAARDWVKDHAVAGRPLLPGAAILEMALVTAREGVDGKVAGLAGVVFERPVSGEAESARLDWTAEPDGEWRFRLLAGEGADAPRYASGRLSREPAEAVPPLDLAGWEGVPAQHPADIYARYERLGFRYGPAFRPIESLRRRGDEALARLVLPTAHVALYPDSPVHPVLLDGALQASLALLGEDVTGCLPYAIGALDVARPLVSPLYAWVRPARPGSAGAEIASLHIDLYDATGQAVASLRDSGMRLLRTLARPEAKAGELRLYRPAWQAAPAAALGGVDLAGADLVLFDTETGLFETLRRHLPETRLSLVRPGSGFECLGDGSYTVRPDSEADYARLLDELAGAGRRPSHCLFAWPYRQPPVDLAGTPAPWAAPLEQRLDYGLRALLAWTKALAARRLSRLRGLVLDHGDRNTPVPEAEAVAGFLRSLRMEQPGMALGALFLAESDLNADALAGFLLEELTQPAIAPEIWRDASGRYRAGAEPLISPLTPTLSQREGGQDVQWVVQRSMPMSAGSLPPKLRRGGVYLITGGLGGLGLIFARYLAERAGARLVLVGRRAPGAEVAELQRLGARVDYIRADATQPAMLRRVVEIVRRHGALHGVVHSAGVLADALLAKKTPDAFARVLHPKLRGALVLDHATRDEPLDFFVLFSSIVSRTGNLGQTDYASANRFLDAFARRRAAWVKEGRRHGASLSIAWPLWEEGGMRLGDTEAALLRNNLGLVPLPTSAALAAFEAGLAWAGGAESAELIVAYGDAARIDEALGVQPANPKPMSIPIAAPMSAIPSIQSQPASAAAVPDLRPGLRRIIAELLKVAAGDIEADVPLGEYGFDSVSFTQFANAINERYRTRLTPAVFFEYDTLEGLAGHLAGEMPSEV